MQRVAALALATALVVGDVADGKTRKAEVRDAKPSRGAYLTALAGCGDCHTPRGPTGEPLTDKPLAGASLPFAPTLPTAWADRAPGLAGGPAGYDQAKLAALLQTGKRKDGSAPKPPMPSYRMTGEDARAVARYVFGLKKPA